MPHFRQAYEGSCKCHLTWQFFSTNSMLGLTCLGCPTKFVSSCQGSRVRVPCRTFEKVQRGLFSLFEKSCFTRGSGSMCCKAGVFGDINEPLNHWNWCAFLEVNCEPFKEIVHDPLTNTWQLVNQHSDMQVGLPRFTFIGSKLLAPWPDQCSAWPMLAVPLYIENSSSSSGLTLHWSLRHGICFTTDRPNGLSFFSKQVLKHRRNWVCLSWKGWIDHPSWVAGCRITCENSESQQMKHLVLYVFFAGLLHDGNLIDPILVPYQQPTVSLAVTDLPKTFEKTEGSGFILELGVAPESCGWSRRSECQSEILGHKFTAWISWTAAIFGHSCDTDPSNSSAQQGNGRGPGWLKEVVLCMEVLRFVGFAVLQFR